MVGIGWIYVPAAEDPEVEHISHLMWKGRGSVAASSRWQYKEKKPSPGGI